MDITAATPEQFDAFLSGYDYTVEPEAKSRLLALSMQFLRTIEICKEGETHEAQCEIAYRMSEEGGAFNPGAVSDGKSLIKKGLGRNAVVKEWEVNEELSGTDAISMLKRLPMAYGMLKPLLCQNQSGGITNFDVIR